MKFHLPTSMFLLLAAGACGGSDGANALISVTPEPAGANCPDGGERVEYGNDLDGDGALQPDEVEGGFYVCDGGAQALVETTAEPPGENCSEGGERIVHGLDDDGDGTLAPEEIEGETYVCHGTGSLVDIVPEPAGDNCVSGGVRIDHGIDDDGDGALDPDEVDGSEYVCGGPENICSIDFVEGYAALGEDGDPTAYYAAWGVSFIGEYGLIGGDANGDPGNWDTADEAWGVWDANLGSSGTADNQILFDGLATGVSLRFERTFYDVTFPVNAVRDGVVVETIDVTLAGAYSGEVIVFSEPLDEIRWADSGVPSYAVDDLRYAGSFDCP